MNASSLIGSAESRFICKQPGRYIGWPTVAKGPDGVLHAVFSGDRDCHVCPFGKVFLIRSHDHGATWSDPQVVMDSPLDDRDAGVCVCPDGTMVVSWFTSHYRDYREVFEKYRVKGSLAEERWPEWERALGRISPGDVTRWASSYETPDEPDSPKRFFGFWTIRSNDGGRTWDEPAPSPVYAPHGPTVDARGHLIFLGMKALSRLDGPANVGFARSEDQGRTWTLLASLPSYPPYRGPLPHGFTRLAEPHVIETRSGKLVGMARCEESGNRRVTLRQTESMDGGRTWSDFRETDILGKPPHLLRLHDGRLLLSAGYRHEPYGQRVRISADEGESWPEEREVVIRDDSPSPDLGYASSAECDDGSVVTLYYQIDRPGEKTALAMTKYPVSIL